MSPAAAGALALAVAVTALVLALALRDTAPFGLPRHPDARDLRDAGWGGGLVRWEALRVAVVASALVACVAAGLPIPLAFASAAAPSAWIRMRAESARDRARRAMTRIVTGTEAALRSGSTLPEALRREADASTDPLARAAVQAAIRTFDLGASLDAGLRAAAASLRDRRMALALETVAVAAEERLPSARVADLLAGLADRLTFEERLDDEVRARASGARQQQKLLALLVPAIALILIASMPSLAAALDSPLGRFVLIPGAVAFEVAGVVLARRIVNEALA
ncbi:MAG: type II secretion system F family protein [Candidatus Limnocylindria bacterium]